MDTSKLIKFVMLGLVIGAVKDILLSKVGLYNV